MTAVAQHPQALDRAVVAADQVHRSGIWADRSLRERAEVLLRLADLMQRDADVLAGMDSRQAGKPITECRDNDLPGAIESIRWFAEAADKLYTWLPPSGPRTSTARTGWPGPSGRGPFR